jgi:hypothetical protein
LLNWYQTFKNVCIFTKILSLTQSPDYDQNPQKQAKVKELEKEIDQMDYKLYDLTNVEKPVRVNIYADEVQGRGGEAVLGLT